MGISATVVRRPRDDQFANVKAVKEYTGEPILPGDEDLWILGEEMVVEVSDGEVVTVPVGFVTDGASVPKPVQVLTRWKPFEGPQRWAGIAHDWLYHVTGYGKRRADDVFRAILEAEGASWFRRTAMYWAVRLFGHKAYNRNQERGTDARIWA